MVSLFAAPTRSAGLPDVLLVIQLPKGLSRSSRSVVSLAHIPRRSDPLSIDYLSKCSGCLTHSVHSISYAPASVLYSWTQLSSVLASPLRTRQARRVFQSLVTSWACQPRRNGLRSPNGDTSTVRRQVIYPSHSDPLLHVGPIIRVTVLGKPLIILNDVEDARALLDKRSKIYSDRPVFEMGGELVGWKYTLVLTPYGARFREYRRFIARLIGGQRPVQENVWPAQERETQRFLLQLLREPGRFSDHVRRYDKDASVWTFLTSLQDRRGRYTEAIAWI